MQPSLSLSSSSELEFEMDWDDFLEAKRILNLDDDPPILFMCGVMGDNGTRYVLESKGGWEAPNDDSIFLRKKGKIEGSDFVWNGRVIRTGGMGGHPALAGTGLVCCAGKIEDGWIWFHSGHYHPKRIHAIYFIVAFIENSCQGLGGLERDRKVAKLSQMTLRIYHDDSESDQYNTTFCMIVEEAKPKQVEPTITISKGGVSRSQPMSIGKSSPMPIGSSSQGIQKSKPIPIHTPIQTTMSTHISENEKIEILGINTYGQHQLQVRHHGAPVWIQDNARTRCKVCNEKFTMIRRRHHCRRCGDIVCGDCSGNKKIVNNPAVEPNGKPETGPLRVCDICFRTQDLI